MSKRTIIAAISIAVLVAAGGAWWLMQRQDDGVAPTPTHQETERPAGSTARQLVIGADNAPLTIVEYIDYKCPNCNRFHRESYPTLKAEYINAGKVRLLVKHLPYLGPDSRRAAEGAYCAAAQGKFDQYNSAVYEYMWAEHYQKGTEDAEFADILTVQQLSRIAAHIGADDQVFAACLQNGTYQSAVTADLQASEADGVAGTPAFIIGDQRLLGNQPYSVFKTLVESQLK